MATAAPSTTIDRFLNSLADCLPPEVAQQIASIPLDPAADERLDELRWKANEGQLTVDERAEYEELIDAMDFVAMIKLKARLRLKQNGQ